MATNQDVLLQSVRDAIDNLIARSRPTESIEEMLVCDMQLCGLMQWLCQCREADPLERINYACDILKEDIPKLARYRPDLPKEPGCYFFLSDTDILYVGTAKNIRQRVGCRFPDAKCIAYMEIDDESRQRIESELIILLQPRFNLSINLKRAW